MRSLTFHRTTVDQREYTRATAVPAVAPERHETIDDSAASGHIVIVYDNDTNTFDEVVRILQQATGCTLEEAEIETWEVHHLGRSIVHHGSLEECSRAAGIIRTIGIRVEVVEE